MISRSDFRSTYMSEDATVYDKMENIADTLCYSLVENSRKLAELCRREEVLSFIFSRLEENDPLKENLDALYDNCEMGLVQMMNFYNRLYNLVKEFPDPSWGDFGHRDLYNALQIICSILDSLETLVLLARSMGSKYEYHVWEGIESWDFYNDME